MLSHRPAAGDPAGRAADLLRPRGGPGDEEPAEGYERGHILIFSTHILQLATDLCDGIVVLNHGLLEEVDSALIHTTEFEQRVVELLRDEGEGEHE